MLVKIFYSPKEVFDKVDEKPNWLPPFIAVMVAALVLTSVLLPTVIRPATIDQLNSNPQMTEEQVKVIGGPVLVGSTFAMAILGTPVRMLAVTGIYCLILLLLGGEVKFKKVFTVTAYSAVIGILGGIVTTGIMVARKSMEVFTNLNLFLPFVQKGTYLI